jgi:hypothetical protein
LFVLGTDSATGILIAIGIIRIIRIIRIGRFVCRFALGWMACGGFPLDVVIFNWLEPEEPVKPPRYVSKWTPKSNVGAKAKAKSNATMGGVLAWHCGRCQIKRNWFMLLYSALINHMGIIQ